MTFEKRIIHKNISCSHFLHFSFTESDIEQFLESMAYFESRDNIRKTSINMRIGYLKDLAKIYHMNTGEDFFVDYPKMIDTLKELEAHWEAPTEDGWLTVGTKRSNTLKGAKNEQLKEKLTKALDDPSDSKRIWKDFCSFASKKDSFDEEDFTEFFEHLFKYDDLDSSIAKLEVYETSLALQYLLEFDRDLSKDFPGISKFIKEKINAKSTNERHKSALKKFCEFVGKPDNFRTGKSYDFKEEDFLAYFRHFAKKSRGKKFAVHSVYTQIVTVHKFAKILLKLNITKAYPRLPKNHKEVEAFMAQKAPRVRAPRKNQFRKQRWLKKYNIKDCVVKLHDISKTLDVAMTEDDDEDDCEAMN